MDAPRSADELRQRRIRLAAALREKAIREERERQSNPRGGLLEFIRYFWHVLEPVDPFVEGWALECLCAHLEAITCGDRVEIEGRERRFNRFLANVPPGFMKSLTVNVFWCAWEWGPMSLPHLRYVAFSYNSDLTERDNAKFRDLICSAAYREMWGHVFRVLGDGKVVVSNDKTGFKRATSFGGTGTGERGHRVLLDDPHKIKGTQESDDARRSVTNWVQEGMQNRLNDLVRDAIVIIMQRVHEEDTSGIVQTKLSDEYCCLAIPMEYEGERHFSDYTGWNEGRDPRSEDGELAWPDRYPRDALGSFKRNQYLWAGQYQQSPTPRGGGIFKEDWWQPYEVPADGQWDIAPSFALASLDTAFKEKEENDYSALTIWWVYDHPKTNRRNIMLVDGWKKKLPLNGKAVHRRNDEDERAYLRRASKEWGLVEWVNFTCSKRNVGRLLIEDSARGYDVSRELQRVFGDAMWGTVLVPARGEKWIRAHAVVDLFTNEMIFAPGEWKCSEHGKRDCGCPSERFTWMWRDWAQEIIHEICRFPRAAHDDLVDSMTMALRHLREGQLAVRREEREIAERELATYRKELPPLYPGSR